MIRPQRPFTPWPKKGTKGKTQNTRTKKKTTSLKHFKKKKITKHTHTHTQNYNLFTQL